MIFDFLQAIADFYNDGELTLRVMNLSQVKAGTKVKILSFTNDDVVIKLMEMGCLPGEEVTVWKKAPLGDPIYILVSGYSLCLRNDEASAIIVEHIHSESQTSHS